MAGVRDSRMAQCRWQGQQGFTLLELVIVMVIMGVAIGLVAPSLTTPMRRPEPPLIGFLDSARAWAIESGQQVSVLARGDRVWMDPPGQIPEMSLAENEEIAMNWPPPSPYLDRMRVALFLPDGTSVLSRFTFQRRRVGATPVEIYTVEIDPMHGEVSYAYP